MSELDPSLKRLLKLSRSAAAHEPRQAPFGFSDCVLASVKPAAPATLLQELQQAAWGITCASLALAIAAGLILLSQRGTPEPEISSALNFVANNLLQ